MRGYLVTVVSVLAFAVSAAAAAADGDPEAGATTFKACKACHQIGETAKNFVGPALNGVVGRKAGRIPATIIPTPTRTPGSPGTRRR